MRSYRILFSSKRRLGVLQEKKYIYMIPAEELMATARSRGAYASEESI